MVNSDCIIPQNDYKDIAAKQTADLHRLAIHGAVQDALGWLTPAEIEEAVGFALYDGLDDCVRDPAPPAGEGGEGWNLTT